MTPNGPNDTHTGQELLPVSNSGGTSNAIPPVELVAKNPSDRNWKGIAVALFVILVICSLIVTAIVLTTPKDTSTELGEPLSFTDIFTIKSKIQYLRYQWVGDILVYLNPEQDLRKFDTTDEKDSQILPNTVLEGRDRSISDFAISVDLSAVLIPSNKAQGFRHSGEAKYSVTKIGGDGKVVEVGPNKGGDQPYLNHAKWAPKGRYMAFVCQNRIYYTADPFVGTSKVITAEPETGVSYGLSDWLFEEEILATNEALWWSPGATKISYLTFNDTTVTDYKMFWYGNHSDLYGSYKTVPYPKAGDMRKTGNPWARLHMYDLALHQTVNFELPPSIPSKEHYITFVRWITEEKLFVGVVDRDQTEGWLLVCAWSKSQCSMIYKEKIQDGWLEYFKQTKKEPLIVNQRVFMILSRYSKKDGYNNIASIDLKQDISQPIKSINWALSVDFDIIDIQHYDSANETLIFTAAYPDPKEIQLYRGYVKTGAINCLTCNNPNCTYNKFQFSNNGKYYIQECLGPDPPTYFLKSLDNETTPIQTILDNAYVKNLISQKAMPIIEFMRLTLRPGTKEELQVEAKVLIPKDLNKEHILKYAFLLDVYGGPRRQMVTTKFAINWGTYLASTVKVIYVKIDGRGTPNRGRKFLMSIRGQVGKVEIQDQLDGVKVLKEQLSYIDENRIGAFGWSYGGFAVGHLLGNPDNTLIRCGISVAPVTDFRYYDTGYTERYLGLYRNSANLGAYDHTNIARLAKNFRDKGYLLVHGTADDNVHFSNTAQLIKALVAADIDFDVMVYPDENHFLRRGRTLTHLYRKMTNFIVDCYNKTSVRYGLLDRNIHFP